MAKKTRKPPVRKKVTEGSANANWLFDLVVGELEQNISIDERETRFNVTIKTTDAFAKGDQATGVSLLINADRLGDHTSVEFRVSNDERLLVFKDRKPRPISLGNFFKETTRTIQGIIRTGHFHYAHITNNEPLRVSKEAPSEVPSNELNPYGLEFQIRYAGLQVIQPEKGGSEVRELAIVVDVD